MTCSWGAMPSLSIAGTSIEGEGEFAAQRLQQANSRRPLRLLIEFKCSQIVGKRGGKSAIVHIQLAGFVNHID